MMINKIFPFLLWFSDYDKGKFRADFLAGLTVALILVPQSMAYAQLAGLPAYYGLYASFLPPMIAALFGSSRQLATGPVAIVSMMTAASLEPLATAGSEEFIAYAIMLAVTVGVFQLLLGILKLGLIVSILSHPVVNGFTNAAAIIIASSQFSKLFGVYVDKGEHHYQTIISVCKSALIYTHIPTLLIGTLAIAVMVILKKVNPKIPNVLVAVIITIVISWIFKFENNRTIPINKIMAPEVRQTIRDFNTILNQTTRLGETRSGLNKKLEDVKKGNSKSEILSVKHELAFIEVEIQSLKHSAALKRKMLRETHLAYLDKNTERPLFYLKGEIPDGVESDGRTWRIKVGNALIDEKSILVTGAGAVVGKIPEGLPKLSIPKLDLSIIIHLFPYAVIISLLGFMEAIAIAKAIAAKTGQKLDPNQELIGQGLANIIGAVGKSYPVSGSFSRSAVNLQANAVTGLSSVVTSIFVIITLLFFTPLLYHLPQSVLAAVIMMAVIGLVNVSGFIHAWNAKRSDGVIAVITFICTLYFAPHLDRGIIIGVVLTMSVFVYKNMRPKVTTLSKSEDKSFRIATRHGLKECDHIAVVRFDGPIIFTNASYFEDEIVEFVTEKPNLIHILIESSGINDLDASGEDSLSNLIDTIRNGGREISFSNVKEKVMDVMTRTHLIEKIGRENIFSNEEVALKQLMKKIHEENGCESCPLEKYIPIE